MRPILELNLEELELILAKWGKPSFHARQIFAWIYQKGVRDFGSMSNLPLDLRKQLSENFSLFSLKLINSTASRDGTEKFLFKLSDSSSIESVIIPAEKRLTACISTQVGCKFACRFCASGLAGFKRDLSTAEIIEQVLYLKNSLQKSPLTHIVFMGTGEPLDNYDNVIKAIRLINSKEAFNIGARRITISSCGLVPGIQKLARENLQVELSVSLHAADDRMRSQMLPINKRYNLAQLMRSCSSYIKDTGRQVTFEYILIKGLNSDLQNAQKLARMLKPLRIAKVNLIPANAVKELKVEPPNKPEILLFRNYLLKQGIPATLRKSRGEDIEAACGQLRLRYEKVHSQ